MHVLLSDFSSYKAVVVARFLKQCYPGITITSADFRKYTKILHSKYTDQHVVIEAKSPDDPAYVAQLAELVGRKKIDLFIPVNSEELGILLVNRKQFGNTLAYWGNLEDYTNLHDKARFQELVTKAGLAIPQSHENLETAILPVVYKPTTASSSKGVIYVRSEEDRKALLVQESNLQEERVIQQYIEGEGVGFSGFFEKGQIKVGFAHRRLAEFPVSGGSSVWRGPLSEDTQERIKNAVSELLRILPWSGFAMFEFKMTQEGELFFIECNPRIWGSIHQGLANGVNYFTPLMGDDTETVVRKQQLNTYLSPLIWASLLFNFMRGNISLFWKFIRKWRTNRVDVDILRDPLGWLALVCRSL